MSLLRILAYNIKTGYSTFLWPEERCIDKKACTYKNTMVYAILKHARIRWKRREEKRRGVGKRHTNGLIS